MPATTKPPAADTVVRAELRGTRAPAEQFVQEFSDRVERIEEDLAALKAELCEIAQELGGSRRLGAA